MRLVGEPLERDRENLSVARSGIPSLDLGLDLVVPGEELLGPFDAEKALELTPYPAVPVDDRSVAIECRPTLRHAESLVSARWPRSVR